MKIRCLMIFSCFLFISTKCFSGDLPLIKEANKKTISISIKGVPEKDQSKINGEYALDSEGMLFLPLLTKPLLVAGLSNREMATQIEEAYVGKKIFNKLIITVSDAIALKAMDQQIHVGGFVNKPGRIPYQEGMTLLEAVKAAGGETAFGSLRRVEIRRKNKKYIYDLRKPKHQKIQIYAKDLISVPMKHF